MFIIYYTVRERERGRERSRRGTSSSCTPPSCMRHAATLRRLVRCVFTRAHECIWGGSGERGSPLRSSSSYFQRAIIKGKAGRERCARVKGKGINYCRVPGEICKLNSARARERGGEGGYFSFFTPLPSSRRGAFRRRPHRAFDYARLIPPYFSAPFEIFAGNERAAAATGQFEWCSFFFFFVGMR